MNEKDRYYKILGLEVDAPPDQVRQAYRDLVKVWHPDRFANDPRLQQKANEKLKEINNAYKRLQSGGNPTGTTTTRDWENRGNSQTASPKPQPHSGEQANRSHTHRVPLWQIILLLLIIARAVDNSWDAPKASSRSANPAETEASQGHATEDPSQVGKNADPLFQTYQEAKKEVGDPLRQAFEAAKKEIQEKEQLKDPLFAAFQNAQNEMRNSKSASVLTGVWTNDAGDTGESRVIFVFRSEGTGNMTTSDKRLNFRYTFNESQSPAWLDLVATPSNDTIVTIKAIAEIIPGGRLRIRMPFTATPSVRPTRFDDSDYENTVVLSRKGRQVRSDRPLSSQPPRGR
jgi:hypothetical protein